MPDLPPFDATNNEYYNNLKMAHQAWDETLSRDSL
jgi:hypothetical protein